MSWFSNAISGVSGVLSDISNGLSYVSGVRADVLDALSHVSGVPLDVTGALSDVSDTLSTFELLYQVFLGSLESQQLLL